MRPLLIRAVGERIAIHAREPGRWVSLSQNNIAVVERNQPLEFVPIVNEIASNAPSAGPASTVITLGRLDRGPAPDISFVLKSRAS